MARASEARRAARAVAWKARKLIERMKAGGQPSLAEAMAVCPFRTLLGPPGADMRGLTEADADSVSAVLGFGPGDFGVEIRDDIVIDLRAGRRVLLICNDPALRDHARMEIMRALYGPGGEPLARKTYPPLDPAAGGLAAATAEAIGVLDRFADTAPSRPPHLAIDSVLQIADRLALDQGGKLTDLQCRAIAGYLLAAEDLPPDADVKLAPRWIWPPDAEAWADLRQMLPPVRSLGAGSDALARH
ncbi:MAG TPA: hypothetical protein VFQ90_19995 [Stellaceae bacterium]|jgi:hypothetical protein|nr:hypothetical protein [Stellaceae bacterium]